MLQRRLIIFIVSSALGLLILFFLFPRSMADDSSSEASVVYSATEEQHDAQAAWMEYTASFKDDTIEPSLDLSSLPEIEGALYKTVLDFLAWYRSNYIEIFTIQLVDTDGPYYRVDFEGTEAYLALLKESGYISDAYIARWREYFKKCDENFIEIEQPEGPAEGFEFDFVLWTQTIDETLEAISRPELLSCEKQDKGYTVKVEISMRLGFRLSLYDGTWKIDEIFNVAAEDNSYVR